VTAFSTLNVLPAAQLDNLNELGYLTMTLFRRPRCPPFLRAVMCACRQKRAVENGCIWSWAVAAYRCRFQTQSLVLCPTRELADQVAGELRRLARFLPNTKI
jgi:ATP-independent RNA helicase DbpA